MASLSRIPIRIRVGNVGDGRGELVKFLAPKTVNALFRALPLEGKASIWKEEVYFTIPVNVGLEKEKEEVEAGSLAYWPVGKALCIFYGKSHPYSAVNVVGKVTDNLEVFRQVKSGTVIRVEKSE